MRMEKNGDKNETFEALVDSCAHSPNCSINKNESRHQIIIIDGETPPECLNGFFAVRLVTPHESVNSRNNNNYWRVREILLHNCRCMNAQSEIANSLKHICSASVNSKYSLSLCHCIMRFVRSGEQLLRFVLSHTFRFISMNQSMH